MTPPRKLRKDTRAKRDAERLAQATPEDYRRAAELLDAFDGQAKSVTTMVLFELAAAVCRKAANAPSGADRSVEYQNPAAGGQDA